MFELCVKSHFSGAHHLEGYEGSCSGLHGHNWDVEAAVTGEDLNKIGIVIDFRVLRSELKTIIAGLDHKDLNMAPEFSGANPSSENIARFIYRQMQKALAGQPCRMSYVTVHETSESSATYREPDND